MDQVNVLAHELAALDIGDEIIPHEPYIAEVDHFVHIDLRDVEESSHEPAYEINKFMLRKGYYDPRRATQFLDTVLEDEDGPLADVKYRRLRELAQVSAAYYELWKVKADFSFNELVVCLQRKTTVAFTLKFYPIINNDIVRLTVKFPLPQAAQHAAPAAQP